MFTDSDNNNMDFILVLIKFPMVLPVVKKQEAFQYQLQNKIINLLTKSSYVELQTDIKNQL